jgi:hypothetical protein
MSDRDRCLDNIRPPQFASLARDVAFGTDRRLDVGQSMSALPGYSDINLFSYCQSIVNKNYGPFVGNL